MPATKTAMALMTERNIFVCQVEGCKRPAEEAHHVLYHRMKGVCELNQFENLQLVCRFCHKHNGKALTYKNRLDYWEWACGFYGHDHMVKWNESLPLLIKEKAYR